MKLRIEFDYDYQDLDDLTEEEYFDKYFREAGLSFDKEVGAIFYDTDVPFMPQEGQRIGTKIGPYVVEWACYEIDKSEGYYGVSRVVVKEE